MIFFVFSVINPDFISDFISVFLLLLLHDDITTIRGKINSQKHYSGALIRYNGTEYRTKEYYVCRESAVNNENDIIFNSNEFVIFRDGLSIHIFVAGNIS